MTPARRRLLLALTIAVPFVFFAALEGVLRLTWPDGALPAFEPLHVGEARLLVPSRRLARRYFADEASPPVPPVDAFAADKPSHGFRVFVLGESSAAGFPYPHNGTFSRVVRDALRDVLPEDSVEVVNLGLAATNSFTLVDVAGDVIAQHPDAVLVYAGHNEYYGALGVGSTISAGSSPALTRLYLRAQRLRTVLLLRTAIVGARRLVRGAPSTGGEAATFMETIARDQQIELGGTTYDAGVAQFRANLAWLLHRFRDAHVPVYVASVSSNLRDQPPFVAPANARARDAYDSARAALAHGDSAPARGLFVRARDADVIRFRAPSIFNAVIRETAAGAGARYVPVAERIDAASPGATPGHELFLEHVHPNRHGQALIARAFVDALLSDPSPLAERAVHRERLAPWAQYEARMELTPFDERIVHHTVQTLTRRWPFVDRAAAEDYRATYRPTDLADSLALLVSRGGMPWAEAKLRIAADDERRGRPDSAAAEYRGLVRDAPFLELPNRLAGRALVVAGRPGEAVPYLERAMRLAPSSESAYLLGTIAGSRRDFGRAIPLLQLAVRLAPMAPEPLFRLSLALGATGNVPAARAAAVRVAQLDPRFPGLAAWMTDLALPPP